MSRTRRLDLLLVSFILSCTGIAVAQVPSKTPAANPTNKEPRAFALRAASTMTAPALTRRTLPSIATRYGSRPTTPDLQQSRLRLRTPAKL